MSRPMEGEAGVTEPGQLPKRKSFPSAAPMFPHSPKLQSSPLPNKLPVPSPTTPGLTTWAAHAGSSCSPNGSTTSSSSISATWQAFVPSLQDAPLTPNASIAAARPPGICTPGVGSEAKPAAHFVHDGSPESDDSVPGCQSRGGARSLAGLFRDVPVFQDRARPKESNGKSLTEGGVSDANQQALSMEAREPEAPDQDEREDEDHEDAADFTDRPDNMSDSFEASDGDALGGHSRTVSHPVLSSPSKLSPRITFPRTARQVMCASPRAGSAVGKRAAVTAVTGHQAPSTIRGPGGRRLFVCRFCQRQFSCGRALGGHMKTHRGAENGGGALDGSRSKEADNGSFPTGGSDEPCVLSGSTTSFTPLIVDTRQQCADDGMRADRDTLDGDVHGSGEFTVAGHNPWEEGPVQQEGSSHGPEDLEHQEPLKAEFLQEAKEAPVGAEEESQFQSEDTVDGIMVHSRSRRIGRVAPGGSCLSSKLGKDASPNPASEQVAQHSPPPLQCQECLRAFESARALAQHRRFHRGPVWKAEVSKARGPRAPHPHHQREPSIGHGRDSPAETEHSEEHQGVLCSTGEEQEEDESLAEDLQKDEPDNGGQEEEEEEDEEEEDEEEDEEEEEEEDVAWQKEGRTGRGRKPVPVFGLANGKDQKLPKEEPAAESRAQGQGKVQHRGGFRCTECGKLFVSWKALFGHMRCHPEREWRGIHRPSPSSPSQASPLASAVGGSKSKGGSTSEAPRSSKAERGAAEADARSLRSGGSLVQHGGVQEKESPRARTPSLHGAADPPRSPSRLETPPVQAFATGRRSLAKAKRVREDQRMAVQRALEAPCWSRGMSSGDEPSRCELQGESGKPEKKLKQKSEPLGWGDVSIRGKRLRSSLTADEGSDAAPMSVDVPKQCWSVGRRSPNQPCRKGFFASAESACEATQEPSPPPLELSEVASASREMEPSTAASASKARGGVQVPTDQQLVLDTASCLVMLSASSSGKLGQQDKGGESSGEEEGQGGGARPGWSAKLEGDGEEDYDSDDSSYFVEGPRPGPRGQVGRPGALFNQTSGEADSDQEMDDGEEDNSGAPGADSDGEQEGDDVVETAQHGGGSAFSAVGSMDTAQGGGFAGEVVDAEASQSSRGVLGHMEGAWRRSLSSPRGRGAASPAPLSKEANHTFSSSSSIAWSGSASSVQGDSRAAVSARATASCKGSGNGKGKYVCSKCMRAFSSYQALGGHRSSHRRGKPTPGGGPQSPAEGGSPSPATPATTDTKPAPPAAAAAAAAAATNGSPFRPPPRRALGPSGASPARPLGMQKLPRSSSGKPQSPAAAAAASDGQSSPASPGTELKGQSHASLDMSPADKTRGASANVKRPAQPLEADRGAGSERGPEGELNVSHGEEQASGGALAEHHLGLVERAPAGRRTKRKGPRQQQGNSAAAVDPSLAADHDNISKEVVHSSRGGHKTCHSQGAFLPEESKPSAGAADSMDSEENVPLGALDLNLPSSTLPEKGSHGGGASEHAVQFSLEENSGVFGMIGSTLAAIKGEQSISAAVSLTCPDGSLSPPSSPLCSPPPAQQKNSGEQVSSFGVGPLPGTGMMAGSHLWTSSAVFGDRACSAGIDSPFRGLPQAAHQKGREVQASVASFSGAPSLKEAQYAPAGSVAEGEGPPSPGGPWALHRHQVPSFSGEGASLLGPRSLGASGGKPCQALFGGDSAHCGCEKCMRLPPSGAPTPQPPMQSAWNSFCKPGSAAPSAPSWMIALAQSGAWPALYQGAAFAEAFMHRDDIGLPNKAMLGWARPHAPSWPGDGVSGSPLDHTSGLNAWDGSAAMPSLPGALQLGPRESFYGPGLAQAPQWIFAPGMHGLRPAPDPFHLSGNAGLADSALGGRAESQSDAGGST